MKEIWIESRADSPSSNCAGAANLGLWRSSGGWSLGRKRDGLQLPGKVVGSQDRARRCWHALSVLHTDAAQIIEEIETSAGTTALLADWARLTD